MVGWWIDVGWASIVWFIVCTSILIGGGIVVIVLNVSFNGFGWIGLDLINNQLSMHAWFDDGGWFV